MTISKFKKKSILVFVSSILIVWSINFAFVQGAFLTDLVHVYNWWLVYPVLIPQFLLTYFFVLHKAEKVANNQKIGYYYIVTLTAKSVLAICFLAPWLLFKDETSKPMVGQFIYVFISLLVVEISLLVSYLNHSVLEKEKVE